MDDIALGVLDWIQEQAWRFGVRFEWPRWLLDWALDGHATPYTPKEGSSDE